MARYLNKITGAVIECSSKISGGDWSEIKEDKKLPRKKAPAKKKSDQ